MRAQTSKEDCASIDRRLIPSLRGVTANEKSSIIAQALPAEQQQQQQQPDGEQPGSQAAGRLRSFGYMLVFLFNTSCQTGITVKEVVVLMHPSLSEAAWAGRGSRNSRAEQRRAPRQGVRRRHYRGVTAESGRWREDGVASMRMMAVALRSGRRRPARRVAMAEAGSCETERPSQRLEGGGGRGAEAGQRGGRRLWQSRSQGRASSAMETEGRPLATQ